MPWDVSGDPNTYLEAGFKRREVETVRLDSLSHAKDSGGHGSFEQQVQPDESEQPGILSQPEQTNAVHAKDSGGHGSFEQQVQPDESEQPGILSQPEQTNAVQG